jgi:hypothetical protein
MRATAGVAPGTGRTADYCLRGGWEREQQRYCFPPQGISNQTATEGIREREGRRGVACRTRQATQNTVESGKNSVAITGGERLSACFPSSTRTISSHLGPGPGNNLGAGRSSDGPGRDFIRSGARAGNKHEDIAPLQWWRLNANRATPQIPLCLVLICGRRRSSDKSVGVSDG